MQSEEGFKIIHQKKLHHSLFHANREVKNAKKNNICSLKVKDEVINDSKKIEAEVTEYFHALFNGHHRVDLSNAGVPFVPDNSDIDVFLDGLSTLPDVIRDGMTNLMTIEELEDIVKSCDANKSPGLDGLTYEFYQATFDVIKNDLLCVFQCQLDRRKIVDSNVEGVTRLGPKVDGVPAVDELRPITLLNSDYKMLSKWFVMRMKPIVTTQPNPTPTQQQLNLTRLRLDIIINPKPPHPPTSPPTNFSLVERILE